MQKTSKKVKRFVVDVSVWITLFINRETEWLTNYVAQNKIEIFVDEHLTEELERVLGYPAIKKILPLDSHLYIAFVHMVSTQIISRKHYIRCPDSNDNYLFDIALTAHAKLLVTGDKALLNWTESPVAAVRLADFKTLF